MRRRRQDGNYVEACLAGDWNSAYDVCQFPDSTFLSRKNYVNAMTWKAKQDGTDGQETPEIKSFFMRRKQNLETGENRIYTVRYTLKRHERLAGRNIGDRRRGYRKMELQRVVRCAERQLRDGCRNHRPGGCLVLSGRRAGREKVFKKTADNVSIYKIRISSSAATTIELTEKQKDPYREIVLVQDNSSMEFLPV